MSDPSRRLSDPALEASWRNVLDHWEDDAAHTAFLQLSQHAGQLADAAARYRGMAGDHQRREMAEKKLQVITAMAFAQIDASRSPPPRPNRLVLVAAMTISLLLGFVILLALRR